VKITAGKLRRIIKEELERFLEADPAVEPPEEISSALSSTPEGCVRGYGGGDTADAARQEAYRSTTEAGVDARPALTGDAAEPSEIMTVQGGDGTWHSVFQWGECDASSLDRTELF